MDKVKPFVLDSGDKAMILETITPIFALLSIGLDVRHDRVPDVGDESALDALYAFVAEQCGE